MMRSLAGVFEASDVRHAQALLLAVIGARAAAIMFSTSPTLNARAPVNPSSLLGVEHLEASHVWDCVVEERWRSTMLMMIVMHIVAGDVGLTATMNPFGVHRHGIEVSLLCLVSLKEAMPSSLKIHTMTTLPTL